MSCLLKKLLNKKTTIFLLSVVFFLSSTQQELQAQKRFSKAYPASKNVSLQLTNRTGTVEVEGWNKDSVQISAYMEAPAANIIPQSLSGMILINVVKDNQGRNEVGSVNFKIKVPYYSSVNIETVMGNLKVTNVTGVFVRAHIASDGDITLTNISASAVSAENGIGDIFFDGDIKRGGRYRFASLRGAINLHIPFESSFNLVATAPSTREINVSSLKEAGLRFVSEGRRVVGQIGDGSATLNVINQRGTIAFIRR